MALVLSFVLGGISTFAAINLHKSLDIAKGEKSESVSSLAAFMQDGQFIRKATSTLPIKPAQPMMPTVTRALSNLRFMALDEGIEIANFRIDGANYSGETVIKSTEKPVSGLSGIVHVHVRFEGKFDSLQGLQKFMDGIKSMPIAVTRMKLHAHQFIFWIDIFGKPSSD